MSDHPFGHTDYLNYDPEQINTPEDAAELFRWLSGRNEQRGDHTAAAVYRDCADLLDAEVAG